MGGLWLKQITLHNVVVLLALSPTELQSKWEVFGDPRLGQGSADWLEEEEPFLWVLARILLGVPGPEGG